MASTMSSGKTMIRATPRRAAGLVSSHELALENPRCVGRRPSASAFLRKSARLTRLEAHSEGGRDRYKLTCL